MIKSIRFAFIALLATAFITSCKEETEEVSQQTYNEYFPDQVGTYIIYDCDSLYYNDFTGNTDTFRFQIKEYYESEFTDNSGRRAIRLERYKRASELASWQLKDVWFVVKSDFAVEKVEEDVRMLKLRFPLKEGLTWNINALNNKGEREVEASKLHEPFNNGSLSFDSTVTVENTDPTNLINEYRDTEVFARNFGLVYKRFVDVEYVLPPATGIRSGVVYTMKAIEKGTE